MGSLIDSDWLIDALVGVPTAAALLDRLGAEGIGVSIISDGELCDGAIGSPDPNDSLRPFRAYLNRLATIPPSGPITERFARPRAMLQASGRLIPDCDLLIGATAVHHGLVLVSRIHRHFKRIPDLKLYQPAPT